MADDGDPVAAQVRPVIMADGLCVAYPDRARKPTPAALDNLSLTVAAGAFVAVIGRSGAGKTTLLRTLTGFVRPSAGRLTVNGLDVAGARGAHLRRLRRETATIYQHFNLVERSSVLDNVLIGRLGYVGTLRSLLGWFPERDRRLAYETLCEFGLGDRATQRADKLSGGERQRVAIARALVQQPRLVLADEPAASLDVSLTRVVLETLRTLNREQGLTVVVNLHDLTLARAYADRILALREGRLVFDGSPASLTRAVQKEIYHDGSKHASRPAKAPRRDPAAAAAAS